MKALPAWHQEYVRFIRASHHKSRSTSWEQAKRQTDAILAGKTKLEDSTSGFAPVVCVFPSRPLRAAS